MGKSDNSTFPSPCGVRRVRDLRVDEHMPVGASMSEVSVPLRGKEGAGLTVSTVLGFIGFVSVPLRGKEGAGLSAKGSTAVLRKRLFPSPCGVRRVRDSIVRISGSAARLPFPSPCGVRRVRDISLTVAGMENDYV